MKILVTGSSGTIGTRLCEKLLSEGHDIVGADWKPNKWQNPVDERTINIDLRDKVSVLERLPDDADLLIHLAANARVYDLVVDPSLARDNFETTFNMLEYARQKNIKRFMFASSREVYGNSDKPILSEDDSYVKNCESPYTASKILGEALVHSYQQCYGIDFVIFRFSNVYGMYDESDRVVPQYIRFCLQDKNLPVFGRDKLLDFTHVDDCIDGINLCIAKFAEIKNDTFNIAFGQGTSILEVAQLMKELTGSKVSIDISGSRTGEVVKYVADISKAQNVLGYEPKVTIVEGIKRSIGWYCDNREKISREAKPL